MSEKNWTDYVNGSDGEEEKRAYYQHKKEVIERELKPVADALGVRTSYYRTSFGHELVSVGDSGFINVTGCSMEIVKRRFVEKISAMMADKKLEWIFRGEAV